MSADGELAVSASTNTIRVWHLASGRELHTLFVHTNRIRGVTMSPDGKVAISTSDDKTLKVWDVASGRELRTLKAHSDAVWGVAMSADAKVAASSCFDGTLIVWDVTSGRELGTVLLGNSIYERLATAPHGFPIQHTQLA